MKKITNVLYWIAFAAVAAYFAYSKGWILADFESITPQQASALLRNHPDITLLDVRTPQEFSEGHIEGATLIPVGLLEKEIAKLEPAKNKQIIVYCHSGNRSVAASRILVRHGFVPLNVKGGISGWKEEGLSVTR